MAYDSETYLPAEVMPVTSVPQPVRQKHNIELLRDRIADPSVHYNWTNPKNCIIGHAAKMAGIGREGGRYGRNYAVAKWMGVSPYVVQKIDTDATYAGALIGKGRQGALRRLDQLMRSGQVEGYVRHPSGFRAMLESLSA